MALEPHRTAHVRFEELQRGEGMARSRGRGLSEGCVSPRVRKGRSPFAGSGSTSEADG